MTVSSQTNNATFVGNGVTTDFPLPFRFFSNSDVFAYFIDPTTGASTPMVLGTDYTLTGAGEPEVNGNAVSVLTTTAPLANLRGLYVERIMQEVQSTDIVNQGEFFASTHEDVFDRLTMLIQQANANSHGAIRVAIGDPEPQRLVPAARRANLILGFDALGQPITVAPVSGSATDLAMNLANNADPAKGAALVGFRDRTVTDRLSDEVSAKDVATLDELDSISANKFIPAGNHTFNGANIATIGDIEVSKRAVVSNGIYSGIVQQDAGIAWLQHNHLEQKSNSANGWQAITSGNIPWAPLFAGQKQKQINVLAYWYQDFGLEATRAAHEAIGLSSWYDWRWLHHDAAGDGYQAERHPSLGYYRGDDPRVLDWQSYWLNEAGVSGVIPQTRGGAAKYAAIRATWANPSDVNHWMYQLFNNAPNFKQLTYALWAWSAGNNAADRPAIEASFDELLAIYQQFPNFSYVRKNGGVYPIVFAFEGDFWRGAYDNYVGKTNTRTFLIAQAAKFKAAGFSGFAVLSRNSSTSLVGDAELEAGGCLYFDAEYSSTNYTPSLNGGLATAVDYEDLAIGVGTRGNGVTFPYKYVVPNIMTSRKSHSAHPSTFNHPGTTPALFELMCRNVLTRMAMNGNPRILTIYNVSEWAEAGAALQPNMRDGKGYLAALKGALDGLAVELLSSRPYSRQAAQFLSAASVPIVPSDGSTTVPFTVSFAWTSTAAPVIQDPLVYHGKRIRLMLDQASAHNGPMTIEDIGTRAGSGLRLTAATVALNRNDSIELEYDANQSLWVQVGSVVNVL